MNIQETIKTHNEKNVYVMGYISRIELEQEIGRVLHADSCLDMTHGSNLENIADYAIKNWFKNYFAKAISPVYPSLFLATTKEELLRFNEWFIKNPSKINYWVNPGIFDSVYTAKNFTRKASHGLWGISFSEASMLETLFVLNWSK